MATLTIEELRAIGISSALIEVITGLQRSPYPSSSWQTAKEAGATPAQVDFSLYGVTTTYNPFSTTTPTLGQEEMGLEDKSVLALYFKCPCNPKRSVMELTSRAKFWDHAATQQHRSTEIVAWIPFLKRAVSNILACACGQKSLVLSLLRLYVESRSGFSEFRILR